MVQSNVRPVIHRLLSNRNLRARYLVHVRTIVDEWLDWKSLGPVFEDYRALIAEDVLYDTRNPSSFAEFFDSDIAEPAGGGPFGAPPGMRRFVEERRTYLLKHPEIAKPRPVILSVDRPSAVHAGRPVPITAQVARDVPAETVLLYYAMGRGTAFQKSEMNAAASPTGDKPGHAATRPRFRPHPPAPTCRTTLRPGQSRLSAPRRSALRGPGWGAPLPRERSGVPGSGCANCGQGVTGVVRALRDARSHRDSICRPATWRNLDANAHSTNVGCGTRAGSGIGVAGAGCSAAACRGETGAPRRRKAEGVRSLGGFCAVDVPPDGGAGYE